MNNKRRRLRVPKKPKFLSLRRQFPPCVRTDSDPVQQSSSGHQIDLMENQEHENVSFFFSVSDASLTGILDHAAASNSSHATDDCSRPDDLSPSVSLRNALRSQERESSDEKWVSYSEVVKLEEEVSSAVVDLWLSGEDHAPLSLKLDYDDVVRAWSGGPLYINHASDTTQIVPDVTDDNNVVNVGYGNIQGWWAVPEMGEEVDEDEMVRVRMDQREASLLRYKAKRQNRLFSKKIRYQVRKLNAEKRPRLKGRFVKRD